jgi:hypothetical protein
VNGLSRRNVRAGFGAATFAGAICPRTKASSGRSRSTTSTSRGLRAAGTGLVISARLASGPASAGANTSATPPPDSGDPDVSGLESAPSVTSIPSPTASAIAAHTAVAAGYCSTAGTDGSRAVRTAAAAAGSRVWAPESSTTRPSASVTSTGRSTSISPTGASSSSNRDWSTTSSGSIVSPRRISASRRTVSAPASWAVSARGKRSVPSPPLASALTGTVITLPPGPDGLTTTTARDANRPSSSTAATSPVGVSGNTNSGRSSDASAPSVEWYSVSPPTTPRPTAAARATTIAPAATTVDRRRRSGRAVTRPLDTAGALRSPRAPHR